MFQVDNFHRQTGCWSATDKFTAEEADQKYSMAHDDDLFPSLDMI